MLIGLWYLHDISSINENRQEFSLPTSKKDSESFYLYCKSPIQDIFPPNGVSIVSKMDTMKVMLMTL